LIFIKTVSRAKASLSEAKVMQARVFIFVRTLARTRIACRPSFLSRVGAARFWQMLSRQMSLPRFAALLALVLLTAAAVFHGTRGAGTYFAHFVSCCGVFADEHTMTEGVALNTHRKLLIRQRRVHLCGSLSRSTRGLKCHTLLQSKCDRQPLRIEQ
jgi:hypothetical protein